MKKVRIAPRTSTSPLSYPTTVRHHDLTILTSMPAGKMTPIAAIPVLREDSARVRMNLALQMMETSDLLINPINVSVKAYLVPNLAFDRFTSFDDLVRSYEGKPPREGLPVTPYFQFAPAKAQGADPILRYLGKHARQGQMINMAYHEAYNLIWNFRASNRSADIKHRTRLDDTLAPAFWHHSQFAHIVPDWDQAVMEGSVALDLINNKIAVRGLGTIANAQPQGTQITNNQSGTSFPALANERYNVVSTKTPLNGEAAVFAELRDGGLTVSLANIEQARKTQAFARLREQFTGHDDDYIIDTLMAGLSIPDQMWRQPILLADLSTQFGMAKRYATNGPDLTESVVNGATMLGLNFGSPKCPCGGVIMIVAEALPEQLFERTRDPYLHITGKAALPDALRDTLDPEPVEVVTNGYIDADHTTPNAAFGYAPLNHVWNYAHPAIGGRFYNPKAGAPMREDRQRIWAVEVKDPVLSDDFYIAKTIHMNPFVDWHRDPFEVVAEGAAAITGITQFGPVLVEAQNNYEEVMAEAPKDRIVKPAAK